MSEEEIFVMMKYIQVEFVYSPKALGPIATIRLKLYIQILMMESDILDR